MLFIIIGVCVWQRTLCVHVRIYNSYVWVYGASLFEGGLSSVSRSAFAFSNGVLLRENVNSN